MTDHGRKLRTLVNFQKANMDIQAEKLTEYERRIAQLMAERDVLAKRVKALEADAGRYRWLSSYLVADDTQHDDALIAAKTVEELNRLIDSIKGSTK